MKKIIITIITVFSLNVGFGQVNTNDSLALVDLYNSTNGSSWTNKTNWLSATNPVSNWFGITVSGGRVQKIQLSNNALAGSIQASITTLDFLTFLDLSDNSLTGTIPSNIGSLTRLVRLWLNNNSLSGSIPSSISTCLLLDEINFTNNNISGSIPAGLGNLPLTRIWLGDNSLSGAIPSNIFNNSSLLALSLNDNNLSGGISNFAGISSCKEIYLGNNSLSGNIPSDIGSIGALEQIWLDGNNFTGSIPSNITNLSNLKYLGLSYNSLSGNIPNMTASLSDLEWVFANNNHFTSISGMSSTANFVYLDLSTNSLDFSDLTNIISPPATFSYSPQDSIGSYNTINTGVGATLNIPTSDNTSGNTYAWFKDGTLVPSQTSANFNKSNVTIPDAGIYNCHISNPSLSALTLVQRNTTVAITGTPAEDSCGIYRLQNKYLPLTGGKVMIYIRASSTIPSGIIGMDVCMNYNPANLFPTGKVILQSTVHGGSGSNAKRAFYDNNGEFNISIYYNYSAPASIEFTGVGNIVGVEFQSLTSQSYTSSDITICGIDEGYANSTKNACSGLFYQTNPISYIDTVNENSNKFTYKHEIRFWGLNARKLKYDISSPNTYIETTYQRADLSCVPYSIIKRPNLYGNVSFNDHGRNRFEVKRDIDGTYGQGSCQNMNTIINKTDVDRIAKIACKNPVFTPNVHSIIAADVNQDGVVRANDATLAHRRYNGDICEFPQFWNYNTNGTPNGAGISRDWLFVGANTISNYSEFSIDATYPNTSGTGFSRDLVPYLDDCIWGDYNNGNNITEKLHAILLGDVTGNWAQNNGTFARPSTQDDSSDESKIDDAKSIVIFNNINSEGIYNYSIKNDLEQTIFIKEVRVYSTNGKSINSSYNNQLIKIDNSRKGMFIILITLSDDTVVTEKVIIQ